jgi:hypothetical protein
MEAFSLIIAVVIAIAVVLDRRDKKKENTVRIAVGIIDEAICYSEQKNFQAKREAVFNAAKIWRKNPPEVLKDEVMGNAFMMTAMQPVRDMAHNCAAAYIKDAIATMPDLSLSATVHDLVMSRLDLCIRTRIVSAKMGTQDTIHMFLYRYV